MTLLEIAQIYTDLVNADSEIPDSEYHAKDLIGALRTKYHNMLMEQMQMDGIEFIDRLDATRIAFELTKQGINRSVPIKSVPRAESQIMTLNGKSRIRDSG